MQTEQHLGERESAAGFRFPYRTLVEAIELAPGFALTLERLASLDETIDALFVEYERTGKTELFETLCPYFGVPWPAGLALARFALAEALAWRGRQALELGCGLALPSLALASAGVLVTATDLHPDVPVFLARNLAWNEGSGSGLQVLSLDWRSLREPVAAELILGSDLLYDRSQIASLVTWLREQPCWREAWFADPGRPYWDPFVALVRAEGWRVQEELRDSIFFARIWRD